MIVVDTTVWIDFFDAKGTIFDRHLTQLIQNDAPLALVDIVYCEVLQGIRDEVVYRRARSSLLAHPILRSRAVETFEMAARLYRTARRRGLAIRSTVDCVIAATCLEAGAEIYHNDRDYDALAKISTLMIHRPT